jgi:hypothetical protein
MPNASMPNPSSRRPDKKETGDGSLPNPSPERFAPFCAAPRCSYVAPHSTLKVKKATSRLQTRRLLVAVKHRSSRIAALLAGLFEQP